MNGDRLGSRSIIVFGAESDGRSSPMDHASLLAYDTAKITDQILKYTGYQFSELEIVQIRRKWKNACSILDHSR